MAKQLGFADAFLADKAGQNRRLARIGELIDWAAMEALLPGGGATGGPGRPAYRPLAMFRALLLAQWYQLSDPALEEALADRISFRHFCGFGLDEATPDETTFCRFRASLSAGGRASALMAELDRQLGRRGLLVKEGTMIDATLIEAHAARPPLAGEPTAGEDEAADRPAPANRQITEHRLIDADARFAKKGGQTVYGYKAHIGVDLGSGLIRRAILTPANINKSTPADDLIMGDEKAIYADKAYEKRERREALKARGIKDRIMHRAHKYEPKLPFWKARRNRLIAGIRCAIERTFGTWKRSYGYSTVRYLGLAANAVDLQLKAIAFNLRRAAVLEAA
jgi:transposase, IS5 family